MKSILEQQTKPSLFDGFFAKVAVTITGLIVALVLFESGMYLKFGSARIAIDIEKGDPFYEEPFFNSVFKKKNYNGEKWFFYNRLRYKDAPAFKAQKGKNEVRIFIFGESVADILGYKINDEDNRDSKIIRNMLSRRFPDKDLTIVQCGMSGYTASRLRPVIKEILNHKPDYILLLMGNRILPEPLFFARIMRNPPSFPWLYFYTWSGRLLVDYLYSEGKEGIYSKDDFFDDYDQIASLISKRKVPFAVCTLPSNMADMPPAGYFNNNKHLFGLRILEMSEKNREILEEVEKMGNLRNPAFWYIAGNAWKNLKQFSKARECFNKALLYDYVPTRACPRINDFIRKSASRYKADLIELDKLFEHYSKNGLVGYNLIYDNNHWYAFCNLFIYHEIVKTLNSRVIASVSPVSGEVFRQPPSIEEIWKSSEESMEFLGLNYGAYPLATAIMGGYSNAVGRMRLTARYYPEKLKEMALNIDTELRHPLLSETVSIESDWYRVVVAASLAALLEDKVELSRKLIDVSYEMKADSIEYNYNIPFLLYKEKRYEESIKAFSKIVINQKQLKDIKTLMNQDYN